MANVAIVGRGWGARVQKPAFEEAGLRVTGPAGRDGWKPLVASAGIDLISVVMPPSLHLEISSAALRAGKHVICEKPTAMNEAEAEQLLDLAREHPGRIALIDHELRFLPAWRAARERVAQLGGVRLIEVRYASPGRGDRGREWTWWSDAGEGGGIWGAVGSHFIDTIRFLGLEIEAAQALLHTVITERPLDGGKRAVTSDDFDAVNLRLSGGAVAALTLSAVASGQDEAAQITVHCERAALRLVGEELLEAEPMKPYRRVAGGDLQKRTGNSPGGAFGTGTLLLGQALKRALDEGDRSALAVAATFEDGLAQQRVLDAARRSHGNGGRWERVTSA
ncbi:MAG TPA: Gfo/Idh/MocA family oxidoreductase [Thermoanaerobaculia bacterium]|nr:Gfo/Idh/MocA family oxidoreductase [Thermoanaerobaculia bacterium]